MKDIREKALSVFPSRLKYTAEKGMGKIKNLYEIHLIALSCCYFFTGEGIKFLSSGGEIQDFSDENTLVPEKAELSEIINRASGYSGFSREKDIKNGFLTYGSGCRIGICTDIKGEISSLCIRLPPDTENIYFPPLIKETYLSSSSGILVAGAPASGKTTLLRYFAKNIASGGFGKYRKLVVIDERQEIAGEKPVKGSCQVLSGREKSQGIMTALRLLSPEIIISDEIGSEEESDALLQGLNSGVMFIASVHSPSVGSLIRKRQFLRLFSENVFDRFIFLSQEKPGEINSVMTYGEVKNEICRTYGDRYFTELQRSFSFYEK